MSIRQIQFRWQVFFAGAHQTLDCHDRRVHDPRRPVAGKEAKPTQQKGYDVGHLKANKFKFKNNKNKKKKKSGMRKTNK